MYSFPCNNAGEVWCGVVWCGVVWCGVGGGDIPHQTAAGCRASRDRLRWRLWARSRRPCRRPSAGACRRARRCRLAAGGWCRGRCGRSRRVGAARARAAAKSRHRDLADVRAGSMCVRRVSGGGRRERRGRGEGSRAPVVGSSRKRTEGDVTSSTPTVTRRACPPEMPRRVAPPIRVSATLVRSRSRITLSTAA